ncbi:lysozyme family protein [Aneurinibacillus tyrosinisolvens]|uniref:lysozyme family protein n=1 Tax=Aneurinibacillus tyrosinisolvens TaxID=1443435 RepID=UPI00069BE6D4|nr:lysozyme family protein [Aneurinibacillus tyrosinisolvens]
MQFQLELFVSKHRKEVMFLFFSLIICIFIFCLQLQKLETMDSGEGKATINDAVLGYQPLLQKYAAKYGVSKYGSFLMAQMMQESGGQGGDPMQGSESLGLPPNTITNPEQSIDAGVRYFAYVLKLSNGDLKLATQSYNFGTGFIKYARARGGYSKENALPFHK